MSQKALEMVNEHRYQHGPFRYAILLGGDGVYEEMIATSDTMEEAKEAIRYMRKRHGFRFDDMAILDAVSGRLVSYLL